MLEGFTEKELQEYANECQEKFTKLELDILKSVLTGGICTYKKLIEELKKLNFQYEDEMEDYVIGSVPDLIECVIEDFKKDEENDKKLIIAVKDWLEMFSIVDKAINKRVYQNEKGQICDEYGVPLTLDGKHRVFEVIQGQKSDGYNGSKTEFMDNLPLGMIKGGKVEE